MYALALDDLGLEPRMMEVPTPEPGPNQIRVRMVAAGLNAYDGKAAAGRYPGMVYDRPYVPGIDGAGVVDAVGSGVTRFAVGQAVFGRLAGSPAGHGTFAEYTVPSEQAVIAPIPAGVDFTAAAAVPVAGLTAYGVLHELNLFPEATLLVLGATGGVGSFLVQLAALEDVDVVATATGTQETARMRELGAGGTVDHRGAKPVSDQVLDLRPAGLDGLADLVGDLELVTSLLPMLRPHGRVVSTAGGVHDDQLAAARLTGVNYHRPPTLEMLVKLGGMVASGAVRAHVERTVPLAEAGPALVESAGGHLHGKTVLLIGAIPGL